MYELVLIYCLIDAPDRCVERDAPLEDAVSAYECALSGQMRAMRYIGLHPEWRLSRISCRSAAQHEDPA
jgi:hypothetical protein